MNKLAQFLRTERAALVGYVRRRIDDAGDQDAEDIVQDVIVSLFDRADPTIPIQNLASFIYRALRNRIIDRFRKRKKTSPLSRAAFLLFKKLPANEPGKHDQPQFTRQCRHSRTRQYS